MDLNWLREAGLPVTAQRGRLGGVTMLPGSGLDLTRLTPDERDHLSLAGLDERQRAELNASVESRRALSKIGATQSRRVHELRPLTDVVHVDSRPWLQARASGTTPASLIGPVRRGRRLRIEYDSSRESCSRVQDDHEESATSHKVRIRFPHLEDVRTLLPFGSTITVHGPTEARAHLRDLVTNLAHHYAPSPTS